MRRVVVCSLAIDSFPGSDVYIGLVCTPQGGCAWQNAPGILLQVSTSKQGIHTSAAVRESARKQASRLKKRDQRDKRFEKERQTELNKPHPALGYSPGNEELWTKSKLRSVLITQEDLDLLPVKKLKAMMEKEMEEKRDEEGYAEVNLEENTTNLVETGKTVPTLVNGRPVMSSKELPTILNFGVDERERQLLFEDLPYVRRLGRAFKRAAQVPEDVIAEGFWSSGKSTSTTETDGEYDAEYDAEYEAGLQSWVGRVLDLKNSNAAGLAFANKRRIVAAFGTNGLKDTGRIEVEGALSPPAIVCIPNSLQPPSSPIVSITCGITSKSSRGISTTGAEYWNSSMPEPSSSSISDEPQEHVTRRFYLSLVLRGGRWKRRL